jgi:hypothetical protein
MAGRKDGKTSSRTRGSTVKRTISLTAEASHRLDVHAVGLGLDVSALVEQLVRAHCRRFVLHDRDRQGSGAQGPDVGEVTSAA